ncbi:MAG: response regulator [Acidobacteriia bacterium]|nr:response regulator [Terriglobia bacterium]
MVKKPSDTENKPGNITVLSVGPVEQDHLALSEIISSSQWPLCPGFQWTLKTSPDLSSALADLTEGKIQIVICESDLGAGSWKELWAHLSSQSDPPFLIVTSRLADEYLWAEALNLGAYDVLSKPFDATEVVRTLSQAGLHRSYRHLHRPATAVGHPQPAFASQRHAAVSIPVPVSAEP